MKFTFLILLAATFIACKGQDQIPSIKVENPEIYFINKKNSDIYKYLDINERENSYNLVSFTISNPTDKKMLFLFDKDELFPSSNTFLSVGTLSFLISKENDILPITNTLSTFTEKTNEGLLDEFFYTDSLKTAKYSKIGVKNEQIKIVDNYIKNSIILFPKETRTFKFSLNLPIVREISGHLSHNVVSYKNLTEGLAFKLFYSCNAKTLKNNLPKYLIDELEYNQVEIFNGILESNFIPLKLKR